MAGEYLDPSSWPLWMQSGMTPTPPDAPYQPGDFQRAGPQMQRQGIGEAFRNLYEGMQNRDAGGVPQGPGFGAAMNVAPLSLIGRGVAAAPKTIAAMLAAGGILGGTSQAGQAADQVDPIQGEIDSINARLSKNNDEIVRLGTTMTKSPKGTQDKAITTLQGSIRADQERLQTLQGQFATREDERKAAAELKRQQEAPFQERFAPYSYAAPFIGPAAALATNYGLGRYLGAGRAGAVNAWEKLNTAAEKQFVKKGGTESFKGQQLAAELQARQANGLPLGSSPLLAGAAAGGAAGALEGGAVPYFMNEYDAQTLPPGSPNQTAASSAATNPNWWLSKVALPAGMGALAGAFGGYRGVKAKGPYADPSPKTVGLLGALEAQAAQAEAAAQAASKGLSRPQNLYPGVPPALGPAAWYARQVRR